MNNAKNKGVITDIAQTRTYIIGFILAFILTAISFSFVLIDGISRHIVISGILVSAIIQMLVHLRYFLHLDGSSKRRWNLLALVFTSILLIVFIGGTIWVMYTLNSRMM